MNCAHEIEEMQENDFTSGEDVIVYWFERKIRWYLGVVISSNDSMLSVSHLRRSNKDDIEWMFPEIADTQDTDREQV